MEAQHSSAPNGLSEQRTEPLNSRSKSGSPGSLRQSTPLVSHPSSLLTADLAIDPELLTQEVAPVNIHYDALSGQAYPDHAIPSNATPGAPSASSHQVLPRIDTLGRRKSASPPNLVKSWSLHDSGTSTQPASATTDSPITPLGAYGSVVSSPALYDFSTNGSQADLLSPRLGGQDSTDSVDGDYRPSDDGEGGVPGPKKKKSHARKQPEGHIKRARNAFILFRKHVTDSGLIPPSVEVKHQNISVVTAKMWREAPPDVRKNFQEMARIEKEEHQRKYPGYRYQPVFRRTDIIRRRVRKGPAEDEKVEAVAEALMKGKAGDALEAEIKEQLAQRSDASDSEAEVSKVPTSRRRRREQGQLSKGAIRAQRAQARAKQMRHNLLGHNLLQVSMYNAQQQQQRQLAAQQAQSQMHAHAQQHSHPGMQYAMQESYMPMGYDYDGRPIMGPSGAHAQVHGHSYGPAGHIGHDGYGQGVYSGEETYRLPPIIGYADQQVMDGPGGPGGAAAWGYDQGHPGPIDHWGAQHPDPRDDGYYHPSDGQMMPGEYALPQISAMDYQQPSFADDGSAIAGPSHAGAGIALPEFAGSPHLPGARPAELIAGQYARDVGLRAEDRPADPRMRDWQREAPETPSGHVVFQDRLFDGALGSAMMGERRDDDGLGAFDEAVQQVHDVPAW